MASTNIQQLIASSRTAEAIQQLLGLTKNTYLHEEVLQQSARFQQYQRTRRQGTQSDEVLDRTLNKIHQALLEIAAKAEEPVKPQQNKRPLWQYLTAAALILGMLGSLAEVLNFINLFPSNENTGTGSVTVLVHSVAGKDKKVLPNRGKVTLIHGNAIEEKVINSIGEAIFQQVPATFFNPDTKVEILFEDPKGEPYRAIHRDSLYQLERGKYIALPVLLEGMDQINGIAKDFHTGATLDSVEVRIFGKATYTNKRGEFVLRIPEDQQKQFVTIRAYKEGYQDWEMANVPTTTEQEVSIGMKKKK